MLAEEEARGRPACRRAPAVAGLAALGLAAAGLLTLLRSPAPSTPRSGLVDIVSKAEGSDPCAEYPYFKFQRVLHNNLAQKGPDTGNEGIIYRTLDLGQGAGKEMNREVDIVVNAMSGYTPFSSRRNGMQGKYGSINIQSGSSIKLKFRMYDVASKKQLNIKELAMTFFDLDQGMTQTSRESVTTHNFDKYHLTSQTEVQVKKQGDMTQFMSSTFGTGQDNPTDPMFLTQQQKNRAVSLMFSNVTELRVTLAASPGEGPRFFTFVARPSLLCAVTVQTGFVPPLPDLPLEPPMQKPVDAEANETFQEWFIAPGTAVKKGTILCSTKRKDGSIHMYKSPYDGTVMATQTKLKKDEKIDMRLDDKALVVVALPQLEPLASGPGSAPTTVEEGSTFKEWKAEVGDVVKKGDPIATVTDSEGKTKVITSPKDGFVTARQEKLKPGDPVEKVEDRNIASIGKMPALPVHTGPAGDTATDAPEGATFVKYLVKKGDSVKANDPIAVVKNANGDEQEVVAVKGGVVTAIQDHLQEGMSIDDSMQDHNLATVGKLPPLKVAPGETPTNAPAGMTFHKWHVQEGDLVEEGEPVATVTKADGVKEVIPASRTGIVKATQKDMKEGMSIDDAMVDHNLAVVGKLPPLPVGTGEVPTNVEDGYQFKEWHVAVNDTVEKGQPVATVVNTMGEEKVITASKYGQVTARQEHLHPGYEVTEILTDKNIATIGKFPEVQASGPRQHTIAVPHPNATFDKWYVHEGDKVEPGDKIASVIIPTRRLEMGAAGAPVEGKRVDIYSPTWGTVSEEQPLQPGQNINDVQVGTEIAKLDQGIPWWVWLLSVLCCLCCCLCCLYKVMQKPRPAYTPMPPAPEAPVEETPTEVPDGLRLDFEEEGHIHTVYAKWRPLGIKHNFIAPIVAHDFTINSYAKQELNVKEFWKLRRIGDEELHDNPNFDEVNDKLTNYMKDFPLWPLPIDFRRQHGAAEVTKVDFVERPLGIEFTNRAPIKVSKVYAASPAAVAGVREGWFVTRIGEADVKENSNFREVISFFKEGVQPLDDNGKQYDPDS